MAGFTCFHCKLSTDDLESYSWETMINHECFRNANNISMDDSNVLFLEREPEAGEETQEQNMCEDELLEQNVTEWKHEAVLLLIEQYEANRDVLDKKNSIKKYVWQRIASKMNDFHYKYTWDQIQNKWKSLIRSYKNVKDNNNKTGRNRNNWTYFQVMDRLLRKNPAIDPPVTVHNGVATKRQASPGPSVSRINCKEVYDEDTEEKSGSDVTPERQQVPTKKVKNADVKYILIKAMEQNQKQHEEDLVEKRRFNDILESLLKNLQK